MKRLPKVGESCRIRFKGDVVPMWFGMTVESIRDGESVVVSFDDGERNVYTWKTFLDSDTEFEFDDSHEEHSECPTSGKVGQRKLVILNAPKGCGKDVAAEHLVKMFNYRHVEFKSPVEKLVKSFYSLTDKEHDILYRRENKEVPQSYLMNKSIRDCYIHVSENVIKPVFGRDVFGVLLADSLQSGVSVSSDGGFEEEVEAVAKEIGKENILVVQIHAEGKTFDGDSRSYLYVDGVRTVSVNNLFTPVFFEDVVCVVDRWLEVV